MDFSIKNKINWQQHYEWQLFPKPIDKENIILNKVEKVTEIENKLNPNKVVDSAKHLRE